MAVEEMARVLKPGGLLLLTMDVCVSEAKPDQLERSEAEGYVERFGMQVGSLAGKPMSVGLVGDERFCVLMLKWRKPL